MIAMSAITIKVHNQAQNVANVAITTKDGQPTVIKAMKQVNYEPVDESTGHAPHHLITKRVNQDLQVSFDEDIETPDLIIEGFYEHSESQLIGLAENGSYYYYTPDSGEYADYLTIMPEGAVEGHALGGAARSTPWWVGAGEDSSYGIMPWLVGAGAIGLAAAASGSSGDKSSKGDNRLRGRKSFERMQYCIWFIAV